MSGTRNSSRNSFNRNSFDEDKRRLPGLAGIMWLSFWLFVLFWMFVPPDIQAITVYRLKCPDMLATGDKCPHPPVPDKAVYRVFIQRQIVVARNTLTTYDDCTVFNRGNWECRTPQTVIRMKNGRELFLARASGYSSTQAHAEAGKVLREEAMRSPQVPVWTWHYHYLNDWIRSF